MLAPKLSAVILFVLVINVLVFSLNVRCFAANTVLYVSPAAYTASSVGESVSIQVQVSQVIGLTAFRFTLSFDTTLLACLGWQIGSLFPPPPYSMYSVTVDNDHGTISASVQLQPSQQPASGNGVLLRLTFNATYGTPYSQQKTSCTLGIVSDSLYAGGSAIPHLTLNGTYVSPYVPPQISLSLKTASSRYFEQEIDVNGTVTGDGHPVTDALVALEIRSYHGLVVVARTLSTSTSPSQLPLSIVGLTPSAQGGTPQSNFQVDSLAFFVVTIRNSATRSYDGVVMVNVYDSSNASLGVSVISSNFAAGQTSILIPEVAIQATANSGQATAYASVFSDYVENGGVPLCLEGEAQFTISGSAQGTPLPMDQPARGSYEATFRIHYSPQSNSTGNYTAYASVSYMGDGSNQSTQIQMSLAGDLNKVGSVGLTDLVLLALAYRSKPGYPNWNPIADINGDGQVSLNDLVLLAQNYGRNTNP
jgi:hypothetical protein